MTGVSALNDLQETSQVALSLQENLSEMQNLGPAIGDTLVDVGIMSESEYRAALETSADYRWTLEPEQAGSLLTEGSQATVRWNSAYRGDVHLSYQLSNECSESDDAETLKIRIVNSNSIDENEATQMTVFPNPAKDKIELRAYQLEGESVVIRIIDPMGRTVYSTQKNVHAGQLQEVLGTSMLRNGLYDLQLIDGTHIHSTRIIIK